MTHLHARHALLVLVLGSSNIAAAQGLPTTQPQILNIIREEVKLGRFDDHAKWEAEWVAALRRAKVTDYVLAFAAMTGPNEVWFVTPFASHAAMAESANRNSADPAFSAEATRLFKGDAQFLNSWRMMQVMGRTDLSHGAFPDLAKVRFMEITIVRLRPGHEAGFAAAAKAYAAAATRAAPGASWRVYEVIAGLPSPTFLIFQSVNRYEEFDRIMSDGNAIVAAMTPEEATALQKYAAEGLINSETNRYSVDPSQSYVDPQTIAKDPFWKPKAPAAKRTTQP